MRAKQYKDALLQQLRLHCLHRRVVALELGDSVKRAFPAVVSIGDGLCVLRRQRLRYSAAYDPAG